MERLRLGGAGLQVIPVWRYKAIMGVLWCVMAITLCIPYIIELGKAERGIKEITSLVTYRNLYVHGKDVKRNCKFMVGNSKKKCETQGTGHVNMGSRDRFKELRVVGKRTDVSHCVESCENLMARHGYGTLTGRRRGRHSNLPSGGWQGG